MEQEQGIESTGESKGRPATLQISKALEKTLFLVFIFLAVATILYIASPVTQDLPFDYHHTPAPDVKQLEELDYPLHPYSHNIRGKSIFYHEWTISKGFRRPDGVLKEVYLVNDLFPGPVLEARSGDTLIINVANNLGEDDGISVHWHGVYMKGQNKYDGATGFTQNSIQPGANLTYEIKIADDQWGTFWYHSHNRVQRADGLFGALIIHRPIGNDAESLQYFQKYQDVEERLLLVGDWYHRPAEEVLKWYMRAGSFGNEPVPDSVLINGRGGYNCSMAVPARPVDCTQRGGATMPKLSLEPGKKYRFRVINHGSLAGYSISTNAASLRVVEVDGGHEVAGSVEGASIGVVYPGQRTDLIITAFEITTGDDNAHLSIIFDRENFKYPNPALAQVQQFPVENLDAHHSQTDVASTTTEALGNIDLKFITALNAPHVPENADTTIVIYTATQKLSHLHNVPHGFMNQTSWKPQADPQTPLISLSRDEWDKNQFVPHINNSIAATAEAPWVDLVVNNLDDGGHPFHLHGHDVYVLSWYSAERGWGSYNPFEAPGGPPGGGYNLLNPIKRDTFFVPRRGYTVVRFRADNPGIWMFHCHLLWHQASGMAMGFEIS